MADVFLSYARGDRLAAERLAHAIGETGLTVWWDRHIKGGADFSRDIERQLAAAQRVLVLWSKEAADSRWVRDEASVAADSGRLVSATIDGTPPPLGFRQFQTIDLKEWAARGATIPRELAEALEVETLDADDRRASGPPPRRRRFIAAGAAALLLAGAATFAIVRPDIGGLVSGERQSEGVALAIMPFVTPSGSGVEYLGAGLSSALADSLAPLEGLKITASTSTQALAGKGLTAPDIGKKLGISHLIEGNVQQLGQRYAVSVRLIEARTSQRIWTRTFEGAADELQALKSQMARELAAALRARLGVGQGEVVERGNVDPRAYEAYLRALERVSVREDRTARLEAIKQFRMAASIDPDFAQAHAGYAYLMALSMPDQLGMSWDEIISEQRRATARALELEPENPLALIARATALQNIDGRIDQSLAINEAVLRKSPNFGPAHYSIAAALWMAGRSREALEHVEQAIDRDPFDSLLQLYRTKILYSLGDPEAVRDSAVECPGECAGAGWYWVISLGGFATQSQFREELPQLKEWAEARRVPAADIAEALGMIEALIDGRPFPLRPLDDEARIEFSDAALAARLVGFERGLRYARVAIESAQADSVLDILNEGRVTFTPEQRADPRYHALFRHPKLAGIAAARRKAGIAAGLPVFPIKPYAGR